jgi:hypothetical protein
VPDGWQITSAVVEGDRTHYRRGDDAYESALLEALIDGELLGLDDGTAALARPARARGESAHAGLRAQALPGVERDSL